LGLTEVVILERDLELSAMLEIGDELDALPDKRVDRAGHRRGRADPYLGPVDRYLALDCGVAESGEGTAWSNQSKGQEDCPQDLAHHSNPFTMRHMATPRRRDGGGLDGPLPLIAALWLPQDGDRLAERASVPAGVAPVDEFNHLQTKMSGPGLDGIPLDERV